MIRLRTSFVASALLMMDAVCFGQCAQCPQGWCRTFADLSCSYDDCTGCETYFLEVPCNAQYLWQLKTYSFNNVCAPCVTVKEVGGGVVLSAGNLNSCLDGESGSLLLTCDNGMKYEISVCLNICNDAGQEVNCEYCDADVEFALFFTACSCCQ